jgi:L-ascorbate metabolism protein UlaG (beta-lactamase superfamily)
MTVSNAELALPRRDASPDLGSGSIFFIGNATVLIRYAGFTILTDPTFVHMHEQVPLGYGLHTTRLTNPAVDIADLPPLDFILLSHFHGDHFDQVAERDLDRTLPIVTTAHAVKELQERGFNNAYPIDTWSSLMVTNGAARVRITAMPGRHGPPLSELVLPDVMGSMIEFISQQGSILLRMYITGDTLLIDDLKEIPKQFPDIDVALLHLGGTRVLGIMVTMDAEQGVELMHIIQPEIAIPIHYNDYDVFKSPLSDFKLEVEAAALQHHVHYLDHGETYTFNVPESRLRVSTAHATGADTA